MTTRSQMVQRPRDPSRPWAPSPFKRLAHTHALSVAGDAMFTTAMAGLVFFSVTNLKQARWQVAAALVFTIIPLSLAAPFIGPLIDRARGGRKWMIVGQCFLRGIVCFLLVWDRDKPWLMYPQFTLVLVLAQGYILARGALVPATVHNDDELVEANSKLAGISGVSAIIGGLTSVTIMWVTSKFGTDRGPDVALFVAGIVYLASSVQAIQLPPVAIAEGPADEVETIELHGPGIRHASVALSVIRVVVGVLTFMLAFHFKNLDETDAWASRAGLVGSLLAAEVGFLLGAAVAPKVRRLVHEEHIIMLSLAGMGVTGLLTALMGDLAGAILLAFVVGLTSNTAKQAFDSIVQRDAPDANRGRAFAKFETRFQLWWVLGALVPVIITVPPRLGFLLIGIGSAGGLLWFWVTLRRALADAKRKPSPLAGEPVLVEPRPPSRSFIRGRRNTMPAASLADATMVAPLTDDTQVMANAAAWSSDPDATAVDRVPGFTDQGYIDPAYAEPGHAETVYTAETYLAEPDPHLAPLARSYVPYTSASDDSLFGEPDAPIPHELVATPDAGLFAVPLDPEPRPPLVPVASAESVLYDSAAWVDEDDDDELFSIIEAVRPSSPVAPIAPSPRYRDPGPPSLVPPPPPTDPLAGPPTGPPPGPPPGPGSHTSPGVATPLGPPSGPPGWPQTTTHPSPGAAAPPVPLVSASADGEGVSLVADDGTYPEPMWRDAAPQALPGFDEPRQQRPASGD